MSEPGDPSPPSLSDLGPVEAQGERAGLVGAVTQISFIIGGIGVLLAMATDAIAVIGRHIGAPLLGSIEIVQACVVVLASSAMVAATLSRAHASVHILVERLGPGARALLGRLSDAMSAVVFGVLAAGSIWLAWEIRAGHERTEMVHIPIAALRIVWCASAVLVAFVFLSRAVLGARAKAGRAQEERAQEERA